MKSIRLAEVLERATSRAGNGDMREPVGPESACATPDIDLAEITRAWRERGGRAEDAAAFPVRLPRALPPMRGPTRSAPIEPPPADPSPEAAKAEGRRQKAEGGGERAAETGPVSVVDDLFRELLEGTGEPAPYDPRPSTEEARVAFREIFEDVEEVSDEDLLPESLAAEMDGEAGSSPPPDDEAPTRDSVERLLDHALGEDRDERPSGPAAEAPPIREETEPDFMEPETEVDPVGEVLREFATGPVATSAPAAGVDSFLDDILGAPPAGEMPPVRPPPPAASPPAPTSSAAGPPAVTPPAGASRPSTADELGFLFDELATAAS
ncbi:MAG: hypothetical protein HY720_25190, partial [Planctomycetes bacterium]|nr:hypothetical protein [Planctomycetota bacterium]